MAVNLVRTFEGNTINMPKAMAATVLHVSERTIDRHIAQGKLGKAVFPDGTVWVKIPQDQLDREQMLAVLEYHEGYVKKLRDLFEREYETTHQLLEEWRALMSPP